MFEERRLLWNPWGIVFSIFSPASLRPLWSFWPRGMGHTFVTCQTHISLDLDYLLSTVYHEKYRNMTQQIEASFWNLHIKYRKIPSTNGNDFSFLAGELYLVHKPVVCSFLQGTSGILLTTVRVVCKCTPGWGWWWFWTSAYFMCASLYKADATRLSCLQFLHNFVYECWCNAFEKLLFCVTFWQSIHEGVRFHIQHNKTPRISQCSFKLLWITILCVWQPLSSHTDLAALAWKQFSVEIILLMRRDMRLERSSGFIAN